MNNPLRAIEDYELFLYTLKQQFKSIRHSTVILTRRGASLVRVAGELQFDHGIRLIVRERILYHRLPAVLDEYGYEVWYDKEKLFWYDAQPHPNDPTLQRIKMFLSLYMIFRVRWKYFREGVTPVALRAPSVTPSLRPLDRGRQMV